MYHYIRAIAKQGESQAKTKPLREAVGNQHFRLRLTMIACSLALGAGHVRRPAPTARLPATVLFAWM